MLKTMTLLFCALLAGGSAGAEPPAGQIIYRAGDLAADAPPNHIPQPPPVQWQPAASTADHDSVVRLEKAVEDLNRRIDDSLAFVAYLGGAVGLFGVLLTAMALFFVLRASREAGAIAGEAAENRLKAQKDAGEEKLQEILEKIRQKCDQTVAAIKQEKLELAALAARAGTAAPAQPATAQDGKDEAQGRCRQMEKEVESYADLVARFSSRDELGICVQVARALYNKGQILEELGRSDEAVAAYENLLEHYGKRVETAIVEWLEMAKDQLKRLQGEQATLNH